MPAAGQVTVVCSGLGTARTCGGAGRVRHRVGAACESHGDHVVGAVTVDVHLLDVMGEPVAVDDHVGPDLHSRRSERAGRKRQAAAEPTAPRCEARSHAGSGPRVPQSFSLSQEPLPRPLRDAHSKTYPIGGETVSACRQRGSNIRPTQSAMTIERVCSMCATSSCCATCDGSPLPTADCRPVEQSCEERRRLLSPGGPADAPPRRSERYLRATIYACKIPLG